MTLLLLRDLVRNMLGPALPSVIRDETHAIENERLDTYINQALQEFSSYAGGAEKSRVIVLLKSIRGVFQKQLFLPYKSYTHNIT